MRLTVLFYTLSLVVIALLEDSLAFFEGLGGPLAGHQLDGSVSDVLAVDLLHRVQIVLAVQQGHKAIARSFLRFLVFHDLAFGEALILLEHTRQYVFRNLVSEVAAVDPEVSFRPIGQRVILPLFVARLPIDFELPLVLF